MAQTSCFQAPYPSRAGSGVRHSSGHVLDRISRWIAEWRRLRRRARSEAELRRKLEDYDEHLLRDMGLLVPYSVQSLHRGLETRRVSG